VLPAPAAAGVTVLASPSTAPVASTGLSSRN
jgi:hypothetical protein